MLLELHPVVVAQIRFLQTTRTPGDCVHASRMHADAEKDHVDRDSEPGSEDSDINVDLNSKFYFCLNMMGMEKAFQCATAKVGAGSGNWKLTNLTCTRRAVSYMFPCIIAIGVLTFHLWAFDDRVWPGLMTLLPPFVAILKQPQSEYNHCRLFSTVGEYTPISWLSADMFTLLF